MKNWKHPITEHLPGFLWDISTKLCGIGELFKNQGNGAVDFGENASRGVGQILLDLAEDLDELREKFETGQTEEDE